MPKASEGIHKKRAKDYSVSLWHRCHSTLLVGWLHTMFRKNKRSVCDSFTSVSSIFRFHQKSECILNTNEIFSIYLHLGPPFERKSFVRCA